MLFDVYRCRVNSGYPSLNTLALPQRISTVNFWHWCMPWPTKKRSSLVFIVRIDPTWTRCWNFIFSNAPSARIKHFLKTSWTMFSITIITSPNLILTTQEVLLLRCILIAQVIKAEPFTQSISFCFSNEATLKFQQYIFKTKRDSS